MIIYSKKGMRISSETLPESVSSFSPTAPRGSVLRTQQTRKQIPAAPAVVCRPRRRGFPHSRLRLRGFRPKDGANPETRTTGDCKYIDGYF